MGERTDPFCLAVIFTRLFFNSRQADEAPIASIKCTFDLLMSVSVGSMGIPVLRIENYGRLGHRGLEMLLQSSTSENHPSLYTTFIVLPCSKYNNGRTAACPLSVENKPTF